MQGSCIIYHDEELGGRADLPDKDKMFLIQERIIKWEEKK
jgi:hypothetical protein